MVTRPLPISSVCKTSHLSPVESLSTIILCIEKNTVTYRGFKTPVWAVAGCDPGRATACCNTVHTRSSSKGVTRPQGHGRGLTRGCKPASRRRPSSCRRITPILNDLLALAAPVSHLKKIRRVLSNAVNGGLNAWWAPLNSSMTRALEHNP